MQVTFQDFSMYFFGQSFLNTLMSSLNKKGSSFPDLFVNAVFQVAFDTIH